MKTQTTTGALPVSLTNTTGKTLKEPSRVVFDERMHP